MIELTFTVMIDADSNTQRVQATGGLHLERKQDAMTLESIEAEEHAATFYSEGLKTLCDAFAKTVEADIHERRDVDAKSVEQIKQGVRIMSDDILGTRGRGH